MEKQSPPPPVVIPRPEPPSRPCLHVVTDHQGTSALLQAIGAHLELDVRCYGTVAEFTARDGDDLAACYLFGLQLPDGTGVDLLQHVMLHSAGTPVVFLTTVGTVAELTPTLQVEHVDLDGQSPAHGPMRDLVERVIAQGRDCLLYT